MHDSAMPLTGLVFMFNMATGEVIFGGLGVGLAGMLFYVILTMFIAGLMIGRTPEFLGKKLGPPEMTLAVITTCFTPCSHLNPVCHSHIHTRWSCRSNNPSAHGLSEILYAYLSPLANNGSAFAGLSANTVFYNLTGGLAMLIGRFATIIPALPLLDYWHKKEKYP